MTDVPELVPARMVNEFVYREWATRATHTSLPDMCEPGCSVTTSSEPGAEKALPYRGIGLDAVSGGRTGEAKGHYGCHSPQPNCDQ